MPRFETIDTLPALRGGAAGIRVLLRGDLNVPMRNGLIADATRIERLRPTIEELTKRGCKVIVMSHFDRPKGKVVPEMSLRPLLPFLVEAFGGQEIAFLAHPLGEPAKEIVARLPNGRLALAENLRFFAGEEANDEEFTRALAELGDAFVNDAFSVAHRAHASTEGLARIMPAAAGRAMQSELEALEVALANPERPVVAIIGGAKVSTKLNVLENLVRKVDRLVIGGAMANTFLYAQGAEVGSSLCEKDMVAAAQKVTRNATEAGCRLILPSDVVIADQLKLGSIGETVPISAVPSHMMILDIGTETAQTITTELASCKTVLWNGPLGAFEFPPFDKGTKIVSQAVAQLTTQSKLHSIAGGGDTIAALASSNVLAHFSYVSAAGGAFLEWLEGKELPAVAALYA
ncbi:MAG: phosphoglycerate kinase [Pseudomonadota bacterium]|nr:phosphoglycerate kinase [Pseudomonadota bacterium]